MFTTMQTIKAELKNAQYLGDGFFRNGNKEIHAAWNGSKWSFVSFDVKTGQSTGSFDNLELARNFLGV